MMALHIALALGALLLGAWVLARRKGTASHKRFGRTWVALMIGVALTSFFIFELNRGSGPSWIHLLSVWTLVSLALAVWFIRRGNVRAHAGFMVGTFAGLAVAGSFAASRGLGLYRFFEAFLA
jgi:uncharacterized membrane protein